jgi:hypothetical protein
VVHGRRPGNDLRGKEARQHLTGKITNVGPDPLSYDMNTYGGCSVAIIFLFDTNQADSVSTSRRYGRAIAIHSGPCLEQGWLNSDASSRAIVDSSSNMAFLLSAAG